MDRTPTPPLQTVDRALQVLQSFSETRTSWGVTELAAAFDLNTSTSQRLLAALATRGFLIVDAQTRRYSLGPAMWRMATLWERSGGLARLAEPVLSDLAGTSGRTATFTTPDGLYVRCIAAVDGSAGPVRSHPLVGDLYPAHAGATSRAYFAFLDPLERRNMFAGRPFARYTELTEIDEAAIEQRYDETYRDGWAYSEGEYDPRTRAIAAPVRIGRRPIGSISLVEPKRLAADDDVRDHAAALLDAAQLLADRLVSRRPGRPPSAPTPTERPRP